MPDNVDSYSEDKNVVVLKGVSKQAAKKARMTAKERQSCMKLVNAFCDAMLEDPQLWMLPTSDSFQTTVTAIAANPNSVSSGPSINPI